MKIYALSKRFNFQICVFRLIDYCFSVIIFSSLIIMRRGIMNIILIVSDTLRRDHLSCYGNKWISTPYVEKFSKDSFIFDNAYTASFPNEIS